MSPRAPLPNRGDERVGNAELARKPSADTEHLWLRKDFPHLLLSQFRRVAKLSKRNFGPILPSIVEFTSRHIIRPTPSPMGVSTGPLLGVEPRAAAVSPGGTPVPLPIGHIFGSRRPVEVARAVIENVAVTVCAMRMPQGLRAVECLAHEAVNLAGYLAARCAENVRKISPPMPGRRKDFSLVFALPIRPVAPHPSDVRNRIIGGLCNLSPFFHPCENSIICIKGQTA